MLDVCVNMVGGAVGFGDREICFLPFPANPCPLQNPHNFWDTVTLNTKIRVDFFCLHYQTFLQLQNSVLKLRYGPKSSVLKWCLFILPGFVDVTRSCDWVRREPVRVTCSSGRRPCLWQGCPWMVFKVPSNQNRSGIL